MSQILLVWSALLTILTAINLMLCLAIVRRLKNGAQHDHEQLPDLLAPGSVIGDFTVATLDGDVLTAASLDEPTLVAFVMPGCEPCAEAVRQLRRRGSGERTAFFVLDDGPDGAAASYAADLRDLGEVALAADSSEVMEAFGGISGYPSLFRVEHRTVIAADRRVRNLTGAPQPAPA